MLALYEFNGHALRKCEGPPKIGESTVWLDLLDPDKAEEAFVEQTLGITLPTHAEMLEIESSSRLYSENGAHFMTTTIVHKIEAADPVTKPITFILVGKRLVTVRRADTLAFPNFVARAQKGDAACQTAYAVMLGIVEAMVDRAAELVTRMQTDVDRLAHQIFDIKGGAQSRSRRFDVVLKQVGRDGELISKARESLHSLSRLLTYLEPVAHGNGGDAALLTRIQTETRDIQSLADHIHYLSSRINFLLDATLGMIQIEQNQIIKLFSVAAVVLMPPTLVASIYGMNFKHMPELQWPLGYPMAIGLMVLAAVLPLLYVKRKGWM